MKTSTQQHKSTGRPKETPNTAQMLTVARLFYRIKEPVTKQEIARRLHIDSRKVTALLKEAREKGLVRIDIYDTTEGDLASRVQNRYPHLIKVMIVPGAGAKTAKRYEEFSKSAALAGADYLDEVWSQKPGQPFRLGVSGGETLLQFVNAVPQRDRENVYIHVTGLIGTGRLHKSTSLIHPIVNASILWSRCGSLPGHCEYATVSPYVSDSPGPGALAAVEEELKKVEANRSVRDVIEGMNSIDVAFASIGMVDPGENSNAVMRSKLTMTGLLEQIITTSDLTRQKAVADFSYCLIDEDGNSRPEWRFFLTAGDGSKYPDVRFYRHMVEKKKTVVVMAGPFMVPALKAALRGKLFNVLITDQDSAKQLAKE
jgi:deoxyribonucleoside regulator